jgi:hypothetical protein
MIFIFYTIGIIRVGVMFCHFEFAMQQQQNEYWPAEFHKNAKGCRWISIPIISGQAF